MVKPPKHLKTEGRSLFEQIQADYGITDSAGLALLARAAECLDRLTEARELLDKEGPVTTDRYGTQKAHPANKIELDSRNGFLAALRALNLDIEPLKAIGRPPGV